MKKMTLGPRFVSRKFNERAAVVLGLASGLIHWWDRVDIPDWFRSTQDDSNRRLADAIEWMDTAQSEPEGRPKFAGEARSMLSLPVLDLEVPLVLRVPLFYLDSVLTSIAGRRVPSALLENYWFDVEYLVSQLALLRFGQSRSADQLNWEQIAQESELLRIDQLQRALVQERLSISSLDPSLTRVSFETEVLEAFGQETSGAPSDPS
jgi:hypothetical protein